MTGDPQYDADVAARAALLAWHTARREELLSEIAVEKHAVTLLDLVDRLGELRAIDAAITEGRRRWELPAEISNVEERIRHLRAAIAVDLHDCRPAYRASLPALVVRASLAEVPDLVAVPR